MLPISSAELAQIQSDVAQAACDQTCVIQRRTLTQDAYGSQTAVWNTVATTKAGMTEPTGTQLQNFAYIVEALKAFQVRMAVGTNVREQDLLLIGGKTLTVQVVLEPRSYPSLLTLLATEVE